MMHGLIFAGLLFAFEIAGVGATLAEDVNLQPTAAASTPVTRQEVWQALAAEFRKRGPSAGQAPRIEAAKIEDLDLPVSLPARAGRTLRVRSGCWDQARRRTEFRLECGSPGECLPFLVYLRDPLGDSIDDPDVRGAWAPRCGPSTGGSTAAHARLPEAASQPAVQAGERALVVLIAEGLRMTASVTCLERGREGEIIRVRTVDGNIFRARISGPGRLEAWLR